MNNHRAKTTRQLGDEGESIAAAFLERENYILHERNICGGGGEIDLLMWDSQQSEWVAVEVKTRLSTVVDIHESVNRVKLKRIVQCAEYFFEKTTGEIPIFRIDIVLVFKKDGFLQCEHLENIGFDDV